MEAPALSDRRAEEAPAFTPPPPPATLLNRDDSSETLTGEARGDALPPPPPLRGDAGDAPSSALTSARVRPRRGEVGARPAAAVGDGGLSRRLRKGDTLRRPPRGDASASALGLSPASLALLTRKHCRWHVFAERHDPTRPSRLTQNRHKEF